MGILLVTFLFAVRKHFFQTFSLGQAYFSLQCTQKRSKITNLKINETVFTVSNSHDFPYISETKLPQYRKLMLHEINELSGALIFATLISMMLEVVRLPLLTPVFRQSTLSVMKLPHTPVDLFRSDL